jgi:hypothetical protein
MGNGWLSLRISALYAGLAAAALITGLVLAATTWWGADAAAIVLCTAVLGFVVGRTPPSGGASVVFLTRRFAALLGAGAIAGGVLSASMGALREVVEALAPCAGAPDFYLHGVALRAAEGGVVGVELGARLAMIVWAVSLPGAIWAIRHDGGAETPPNPPRIRPGARVR